EIPNDKVQQFERELLAFINEKYADAFESIKREQKMGDGVEDTLKKAFREFTDQFKSKNGIS
ncbi:MAG: F0F1 ATP synthase subunit alpha, partial [Armatimonadota bacterium]